MPEGCEVALTAEILKEELLHYDLTDIVIFDTKFKKAKNLSIAKKKLPLTVKNIDSKGKLMWIVFDDDVYMTVGFGLEGKWSFAEKKYSKMKFVFESKHKTKTLWWNDMISYGNITFYSKKTDLLKKLNTLGMDFLKSSYTSNDIWTVIKKLKTSKFGEKMIIELLMNQKKLGSGLGNYLSADSLYIAKIRPSRKIKTLTETDVKHLTLGIKRVVKTAYYNDDNKYMNYLQDYLVEHKRNTTYLSDVKPFKKFTFFVYRRKEDDEGNEVIADKLIKGRTTYWVKEVQT